MVTASSIADALGRKNIASAVGVGLTAVSNAVARDAKFPASWYVAIARMCDARGLECPADLFGMRGADEDTRKVDFRNPQSAYDAADCGPDDAGDAA